MTALVLDNCSSNLSDGLCIWEENEALDSLLGSRAKAFYVF